MDECIDVVDENGKPTGKTVMKSQAHKQGILHRAIHVWAITEDKKLLMQQRATNKNTFPGCWDVSCGGHIAAGEEPKTSATREFKEELGIRIREEDLQFWKTRHQKATFPNITDNEILYLYIYRWDGTITDITIQEEELADVQIIDLQELQEHIKNNTIKLAGTTDDWKQLIDELEEHIKHR